MATLKDLRAYMSVPEKPVTLAEMKELTKEDREELLQELENLDN